MKVTLEPSGPLAKKGIVGTVTAVVPWPRAISERMAEPGDNPFWRFDDEGASAFSGSLSVDPFRGAAVKIAARSGGFIPGAPSFGVHMDYRPDGVHLSAVVVRTKQ